MRRHAQSLPQLASLQDIVVASSDDASANVASPGLRVRRDSIRSHAGSLLRHITTLKNCYEVNFSGTRFTLRDHPIMSRADWDAILPFIWYRHVCTKELFCLFLIFRHSSVMVFNSGQHAEVPDTSKRYLLSVNTGSFAYCSGSKQTIDFFLTCGNIMVYESDALARNFAQL